MFATKAVQKTMITAAYVSAGVAVLRSCAGLMLNKVLKPGVAPCIGAMSATASDRLDRLTARVVILCGRPVLSICVVD